MVARTFQRESPGVFITYDRMISPHGLEVTFDKTVHIIFPAAVTYVDLGSANIMAGKADGAENVIRVKATKRWFKGETNECFLCHCYIV